MKVELLRCAEAELAEAVVYYNEQGPGLGFEFAAEVRAAILRVAAFPAAWPVFSARSRRCLLDRFPYGVLYHVQEGSNLVVAVMHLRRDPRRWDERLRVASSNEGRGARQGVRRK